MNKSDFVDRLDRLIAKKSSESESSERLTLQKLSEDIGHGMTYDKIKKYHSKNSEYFPEFNDLILLCNYFGCDADYLTGRLKIDTPTHEIENINEITGLSQPAIKTIVILNNSSEIAALNRLLADPLTSKELILTLNSYLSQRENGDLDIAFTAAYYKWITSCLDKFLDYEKNFTRIGLHHRMIRADEEDQINDDQQAADLPDEIL